jgi:hypothetical protein
MTGAGIAFLEPGEAFNPVSRAAWWSVWRMREQGIPVQIPERWIREFEASSAIEAGTAPVLDLAEVAQTDRRRVLRRKLYRLQNAWRDHALSDRFRSCGRQRVDCEVQIERVGEKPPQFRGLLTCRRKSCPVCVQRRRATNAAEAVGIMRAWCKEHGSHPLMGTLTIRHAWSDSLDTTGRGIRECFRKLQQDRIWRRLRKEFGFEYVCTLEITIGEAAGYHPHLHVAILPGRKLKPSERSKLGRLLFRAWRRIVRREFAAHFAHRRGLDLAAMPPAERSRTVSALGGPFEPDPKGFTLVQVAKTAEYVTKLGLELTDPGLAKTKKRAAAGRTMLDVLHDFAVHGAARDRSIYAGYEAGTERLREITYSGGLRDYRATVRKALEVERKALPRSTIARIPYDVWDQIEPRRLELANAARAEEAEHKAEAVAWSRHAALLERELAGAAEDLDGAALLRAQAAITRTQQRLEAARLAALEQGGAAVLRAQAAVYDARRELDATARRPGGAALLELQSGIARAEAAAFAANDAAKLARERSLHCPRAEILEHAEHGLAAVCRLFGAWFGDDAAAAVRQWSENAGALPP